MIGGSEMEVKIARRLADGCIQYGYSDDKILDYLLENIYTPRSIDELFSDGKRNDGLVDICLDHTTFCESEEELFYQDNQWSEIYFYEDDRHWYYLWKHRFILKIKLGILREYVKERQYSDIMINLEKQLIISILQNHQHDHKKNQMGIKPYSIDLLGVLDQNFCYEIGLENIQVKLCIDYFDPWVLIDDYDDFSHLLFHTSPQTSYHVETNQR